MTVLAIFAAAAAPNIRRHAQRENESGSNLSRRTSSSSCSRVLRPSARKTWTRRGSASYLNGPVARGYTKRYQKDSSAASFSRARSAHVRGGVENGSASLRRFVILPASVNVLCRECATLTTDPQLQQIEQLVAPPVLPTLGIASTGSSSIDDGNSSGPFIGVSSRSQNKSMITYYGIDHHNGWIFTPLFR